MYLRTVRAKGAEGVEFEYIRLVVPTFRTNYAPFLYIRPLSEANS
jgi:hypothetical protein